jgi:hypothetical protein
MRDRRQRDAQTSRATPNEPLARRLFFGPVAGPPSPTKGTGHGEQDASAARVALAAGWGAAGSVRLGPAASVRPPLLSPQGGGHGGSEPLLGEGVEPSVTACADGWWG